MGKQKNLSIIFCCAALLLAPLQAQNAVSVKPEGLRASYVFEDALFDDVVSNGELDRLYQAAKIALYSHEPAEQREYYLARVNFFRAILCGRDFMKKYNADSLAATGEARRPKFEIPDSVRVEAEVYLDRAFEHCTRSLDIRPTADGYVGKSILTLSRGMLAGPLPLFFAFFSFLDAGKIAVKTDPKHLEAALLAAAMIAFPGPPFGKQTQAVKDLTALHGAMTPDTPRLDYFICLLSLAQAHSVLGQKEEAISWLHKAMAVYPQNLSLLSFERRLLQQ